MAIEIETKKRSTSLFIEILFYLSIILLIGVIFSFFMFNYLEKNTEEEVKNTEEEIKKITNTEMERLESKLNFVKKRTDNFKKILDAKRIVSEAIPFLEKICHPQVYFSSATIGESEENKIEVLGKANSYKVLEQQLMVLRKENKVQQFNSEKISKSKEGGVAFELTIFTNSDLFSEK